MKLLVWLLHSTGILVADRSDTRMALSAQRFLREFECDVVRGDGRSGLWSSRDLGPGSCFVEIKDGRSRWFQRVLTS